MEDNSFNILKCEVGERFLSWMEQYMRNNPVSLQKRYTDEMMRDYLETLCYLKWSVTPPAFKRSLKKYCHVMNLELFFGTDESGREFCIINDLKNGR